MPIILSVILFRVFKGMAWAFYFHIFSGFVGTLMVLVIIIISRDRIGTAFPST